MLPVLAVPVPVVVVPVLVLAIPDRSDKLLFI
jgi:hypothetical protein